MRLAVSAPTSPIRASSIPIASISSAPRRPTSWPSCSTFSAPSSPSVCASASSPRLKEHYWINYLGQAKHPISAG